MNMQPSAPTPLQRGWYLDDAVAGQAMRHPGGRTIGHDEHARLAWLTDNASDVHGDAHRSARGPFGQPLVLGALTVAVVIGLAEPAGALASQVVDAVPSGWSRISLSRPVLPGDTLSAVSLVSAVRPDPGGMGGLVERVIEGHNQRSEVVVCIQDLRWAPSRSVTERG
jgi:acyl dehydratase